MIEKDDLLNLIISDINSMETALQVNGVVFYVEPIENNLEVYFPNSDEILKFKDFNDLIENFIINGKPLKEQLDNLDYK